MAPPDSARFSLRDVASDEGGRLFAFGLLEGEIAVFWLDGDAWQGPSMIRTTGPVTSSFVSEIGIDRDDGVRFACDDPQYGSTTNSQIIHLGSEGYRLFDDFRNDWFWCVRVDEANNKWFGGTKLVVTQDMEHGYFVCTPPQTLRDIAFGPDGTAYVACWGHLYRIRDGEVTVDELPWCDGKVKDVEVASDGTIYLAFADDKNVYHLHGAIYFNRGGGWQQLPQYPWSPTGSGTTLPVLSLELDASGRVWANLFGCLVVFEGQNWRLIEDDGYSIFGSPVPRGPLTLDSQGNLWFFGFVYDPVSQVRRWGLCRFDGSHFTVWSQEDGILPDLLRYRFDYGAGVGAISEDQYGNIWAAGGGISLLLAEESLILRPSALMPRMSQDEAAIQAGSQLRLCTAFQYIAPSASADLYVAIQAPSGQLFYVAAQDAEPAFPIFYAAFDGSTEFLQPGPDYHGPGSIPNTLAMKDFAAPPLPLADPPDGEGPTGLALFAYPVPYFANVPLPAYSSIDELVLLNTTPPDEAPAGTYTFHIGITAPSSISNVYRTASCPFEVTK